MAHAYALDSIRACASCRASNLERDPYCRRCGAPFEVEIELGRAPDERDWITAELPAIHEKEGWYRNPRTVLETALVLASGIAIVWLFL